MQRNFFRNTVFALGLLWMAIIVNSCEYDDKVAITEPKRYTSNNIKSYADLFKVFWSVMDQRYNCFYEQSRKDGMNWDAVYKEYYPKFSALRTFGRDTDDKSQIDADRDLAIQYFKNIIDPIIDRHFLMSVYLPRGNKAAKAERFYGGMKTPPVNTYDFKTKLNYIKKQLTGDAITQTYQPTTSKRNTSTNNERSFTYLTGRIKSNPEIYYLTYDKFSVFLSDPRSQLNVWFSQNHNHILKASDIEKNPLLNAIKDADLKNKIKTFSLMILNQWDSFVTAPELNIFRTQINQFLTTEEMSDALVETAKKIKSSKLIDYSNPIAYVAYATPESVPYIAWFVEKMNQHTDNQNNVSSAKKAAATIIEKAPFYRNFLNPLHRGEIKKLILDLRGNGGGSTIDFSFFIERFVTKSTIWSYERTKEGNGRFDYTPWVPQNTKPHAFAMPSNIPIAILTDKGSVSMSEASTLLIKSQGPQVVSIGDYTYGGLAAVFASNPDSYSSGIVGNVADRFYFYMPVSSVKGVHDEIIEGVGIKPDIYVSPPTDAEVEQMKNTPDTFVDRVMETAVKYLSSQ